MRIAVPVSAPSKEALMDDKFGRAQWFLIYDSDSGQYEVVENPGFEASSGAGPAAVQTLRNHSVDVLLASNIGPKARDLLAMAGIRAYEDYSGRGEEVIRQFLNTQGSE